MPRLPAKVRIDLDHWLLDLNLSYEETTKRLEELHKVRISKSALTPYYQRRMQERILERVSNSKIISDGVRKELKDLSGELENPLFSLISEQAFEAVISKCTDPKDIKILVELLLKVRQQEIDFRKLRIAEAQAKRAAKADQIAGDDSLTPDQKRQRTLQIFGLS